MILFLVDRKEFPMTSYDADKFSDGRTPERESEEDDDRRGAWARVKDEVEADREEKDAE